MIADMMSTVRIDREWDAIIEKLAPALKHGPEYDLGSLYERLLDGQALIFEMRDGAEGLWVVSVEDDAGLVAWTVAIAGKLEGGPKRRLQSIRFAVEGLEKVLKATGVRAHRIGGRNWAPILPHYRPLKGVRNGIERLL